MEFRRVLFRSSLQRDLCFEMSQNTGAILIARAPLAPPWVLSFAFHDLYLPQDRSSVTSFYRIGKPPPPAAEPREGTLCRLSSVRTRSLESVCPPLAAVFRFPSRSCLLRSHYQSEKPHQNSDPPTRRYAVATMRRRY